MMKTYTYTNTMINKPENNDNCNRSLTTPTRNEVVAQLEKHFSEHTEDNITPDDICKIANEVIAAFENFQNINYGEFMRYCHKKPSLTIKMYNNSRKLFNKEDSAKCYSPITMIPISCSSIEFLMTIVLNTKLVSLAYVSKECLY